MSATVFVLGVFCFVFFVFYPLLLLLTLSSCFMDETSRLPEKLLMKDFIVLLVTNVVSFLRCFSPPLVYLNLVFIKWLLVLSCL